MEIWCGYGSRDVDVQRVIYIRFEPYNSIIADSLIAKSMIDNCCTKSTIPNPAALVPLASRGRRMTGSAFTAMGVASRAGGIITIIFRWGGV